MNRRESLNSVLCLSNMHASTLYAPDLHAGTAYTNMYAECDSCMRFSYEVVMSTSTACRHRLHQGHHTQARHQQPAPVLHDGPQPVREPRKFLLPADRSLQDRVVVKPQLRGRRAQRLHQQHQGLSAVGPTGSLEGTYCLQGSIWQYKAHVNVQQVNVMLRLDKLPQHCV
jgi:hypothetical protein